MKQPSCGAATILVPAQYFSSITIQAPTFAVQEHAAADPSPSLPILTAHLSSTGAFVIGLGWRYSATTSVAAGTEGSPRMRQIPWAREKEGRRRKRCENSVKAPVASYTGGSQPCPRMRRILWGAKQGSG